MHRKTFIKTSCLACTSLSFLGTVLESCSSVKYTAGSMNENGLLIKLDLFNVKTKGNTPYVIVRHDNLQYPICVYKVSDAEYSAVYLSCSHQGAELQVAGDNLTCPAHGSEFDKHGKVMQGPASANLRTFPASIMNDQLFIDLRKKA
jgi:Rieske Fe-S protein